MPKWTREQLDSLLGRGSIGATRRDDILKNVLTQVQREAPAKRRWGWPVLGFGLVAASGIAVLVVVPRFGHVDAAFRAKGGTTASVAASASIDCVGATSDACPTGSLLLLRTAGLTGYLSAWADPIGGGERVWYYSAETSPPVGDAKPASDTRAARAVKIGPEHPAGRYVVEIRVTPTPMTRDELLHLGADAAFATRVGLTVVAP